MHIDEPRGDDFPRGVVDLGIRRFQVFTDFLNDAVFDENIGYFVSF